MTCPSWRPSRDCGAVNPEPSYGPSSSVPSLRLGASPLRGLASVSGATFSANARSLDSGGDPEATPTFGRYARASAHRAMQSRTRMHTSTDVWHGGGGQGRQHGLQVVMTTRGGRN